MNSSLLAASSWDKTVTVWEVQHMGVNSVNTRFGKSNKKKNMSYVIINI